MAIEICDGILFRKLFVGGVRWVATHKTQLNEINVYPVPDGDTGTNIYLTLRGALFYCKVIEDNSIGIFLKRLSRGALLGARGNSGAILSQVIAGFSQHFKEKKYLKAQDLYYAFKGASKKAYKAVGNPKEGTVLTVVRTVAESLENKSFIKKDLLEALNFIKDIAYKSLNECNKLLPPLAKAGVVDSGGLGFLYLLEGMFKAACFENTIKDSFKNNKKVKIKNQINLIKNRFCLEFVIQGSNINLKDTSKILESHGDSLVIASMEDMVKIHIHTNTPNLIRDYISSIGKIVQEKIDDMKKQHRKLFFVDEITASGDKYKTIFHNTNNKS